VRSDAAKLREKQKGGWKGTGASLSGGRGLPTLSKMSRGRNRKQAGRCRPLRMRMAWNRQGQTGAQLRGGHVGRQRVHHGAGVRCWPVAKGGASVARPNPFPLIFQIIPKI